ncbi:HD-GYP domain-containing protein [Bacillus sp. HMF5848]|uniref:HD-GYP domain-containing protein n=1 Tax=Bacillus sp. HMF5848 TaxID=2495421 RepID=UPI000F7A0672|nr:HD-GYP domain-containing protein [Bacillus sp. HMF5848]RSK26382.1 HD-GYP domain-containing protein [Bacillus sp. HMF5848]
MRLVSIYNCEVGLELAKPIYDENARILLNSGTVLNEAFINRLKSKKISHIYIKSEVTENLEVEDNISQELRLKTTSTLTNVFDLIAKGKSGNSHALARVKGVHQVKNSVQEILQELRASKNLLNLLSHLQVNQDSLFEHALHTCLYSLSIGKYMGINEKELNLLGLGALFHDIGKLELPHKLLIKEKLNAEEKELLQKHTEYGFEMLRKVHDLHLVISHCAYQHHENVDGTGYPRGLKNEDIHLHARIVAVANQFDKLIRQKGMLPHEAMEILWGYCYTKYDRQVIEAFRQSVAIYPIGVTVLLNTGEMGVVVGYNKLAPQRPNVRVFLDANGKKVTNFYDIDLMKELSVMIVKCDAIIERASSTN